MPVIIDGYNFLHAFRDSRFGSPDVGRAMICKMLGDWSALRRESVAIVFDGARPEDAVAAQLGDPRIAVHYSGGQRNADAMIAELVQASTAPRRLQVVSSDREVQRSARHREAGTMTSQDFCVRIMRDLRAAEQRPDDSETKASGLPASGRDAWLREFQFDPAEEPPFEHP